MLSLPIESLKRNWRSITVFAHDLFGVGFAWALSFYLSQNLALPEGLHAAVVGGLVVLIPAQALIFKLTGLYRGIWFFSSLPDLVRIAKAVGLSALLLAATLPVLPASENIPRAVLFLYPVFLLMAMAGGRAALRIWKEHRAYGRLDNQGRPVLIVGAGQAGARLVQELTRSTEWRVLGFIDDDASKIRREIMGLRVLGRTSALVKLSRSLGVRHVIVAIPSASEEERRRISKLCLDADVIAYTVPSTEQLLSGQDRLDHVRPLNMDDLLGRRPIEIDMPEVMALLAGRVVMVTGAGGSIGSELCRQIAHLGPAQLLLFENNEYALYELHQELSDYFPHVATIPLAGDIKDAGWLGEIMRRYAPAVVFHAAAYKHVPLMEDNNAWQAVRNNVLGTYVVAIAALRAQVPEFVLVSTDKAVNPTNVMGATKRLAEMVCQSLQNGQSETRFEIVRFGNVLGSTGSVIPKFQAQIKKGGPITVTHPEITRYFMSIPEASQLVLQAAAMGEGGEIFVLDMGQAIKIADLAKQMIRLSGHHEGEIPIVYTGLRPGEKLFEELLSKDEQLRATQHPKVRVAKARPVSDEWLGDLLDWVKVSTPRSDAEVRRDLRRWVPEYQPTTPPMLKPVALNQIAE